MEAGEVSTGESVRIKRTLSVAILVGIGALSLVAGFAWSSHAFGDEPKKKNSKVLYPEKTELDFEGAQIEGELRNPGEFYFQHRNEEKFDSLVKRRKNFHKEMLRDVVLSK